MNKIAIIDYGAGNVKSVGNMLDALNVQYEITCDTNVILNADKIIFPGQGHFAQAMAQLNKSGMIDTIKCVIKDGKPFLGICLGLQVLFEKSEEAPNVDGLGIFKGIVKKFQIGKTPQIGWNTIKTTKNNDFLTEDFYYFVNSYYVYPENSEIISSTANYHIDFCASVQYKNIVAVQFHPEKSAVKGVNFFKKWLNG